MTPRPARSPVGIEGLTDDLGRASIRTERRLATIEGRIDRLEARPTEPLPSSGLVAVWRITDWQDRQVVRFTPIVAQEGTVLYTTYGADMIPLREHLAECGVDPELVELIPVDLLDGKARRALQDSLGLPW